MKLAKEFCRFCRFCVVGSGSLPKSVSFARNEIMLRDSFCLLEFGKDTKENVFSVFSKDIVLLRDE